MRWFETPQPQPFSSKKWGRGCLTGRRDRGQCSRPEGMSEMLPHNKHDSFVQPQNTKDTTATCPIPGRVLEKHSATSDRGSLYQSISSMPALLGPNMHRVAAIVFLKAVELVQEPCRFLDHPLHVSSGAVDQAHTWVKVGKKSESGASGVNT